MLEPQETEIPLTLGMSTKPSEELQEPDAMRLVQNLHWRGKGEIEKRPVHGVDVAIAAPTDSTHDEADSCGLIVRDGIEVSAISGRHGVVTYDEPRAALRYTRPEVPASTAPSVYLKYCPVSYDVSRRLVHSAQFNGSTYGIARMCTAQYNGIQVVAWIEVGGSSKLRAKAFDPFTGTIVANVETVSVNVTATQCLIDACEYTETGKQGVLIAYVNDTSNPRVISSLRYDHASNQFVADSDLHTNARGVLALAKNGSTGRFYLATVDNTSGNLVVQDRTVGSVSTTHEATHGATEGVCIVKGTTGSARTLIVSATTSTVYAEEFDEPADLTEVFTASSESFTAVTAAEQTDSDHAFVVFAASDATGTPASNMVRTKVVSVPSGGIAPVVSGPVGFAPHCTIVGNAFTLHGYAHVPLVVHEYGNWSATGAENRTVLIARHRNAAAWFRIEAVARLLHERYYSNGQFVANKAYVDSSNNVWLVMPGDVSADSYGLTFWPQAVYLSRISGARPMPMPYASPCPGVVMSAGGVCWELDGESAFEAAPVAAPRIQVDTSSGSGVTGTYSVRAMYTFVDAAGRLHRLPGASVTTSAFTDNQFDVYVSVCPMRAFDGVNTVADMEPELYVTASGPGSTYYLVADANGDKATYSSMTADGLWYKFTAISPANSVTNASTNAVVQSSELEPSPPPAFVHICKVVDRMVAVDAEDRSRIWFSKPLLTGFGVEWTAENTFTVADECTAVVDMGGGIVVLARGGIYLVDGEGPDATGVGAFSPARKLNHTVDCIDPVSVCRTPMGVLFRGRRGFYLLGTDMSAQPFGLPIDPEVLTDPALDPSLSASYRMRTVYQEQTNEIQICGVPGYDRLVYNILEQKWSKYDASGVETRDLAIARGKLWQMARVSGLDRLRDELLFAHSGTAYNADADTPYEIGTPWYRLDQVGGMVRLWRVWLVVALDSAPAQINTLSLAYYINNTATAQQTVSWTGAELSNGYDVNTSERVVRLPFIPNVQAVHSFKFVVTCTFTGTSSGPKPLALRLQFGTRPSKNKRNRFQPKG